MPKVSIVVPVYGVEKYIEQFLQSIREQTLEEIEVILVDDGSKDNCPFILDKFAEEDERYKVIHQSNGGVSAARNVGLAHVTGEYVFIVDSDDWLTPDACEKLYKAAKENDADMVYGDWIREIDNGSSSRVWTMPKPFVTNDPETIALLQCVVFTNIKVKIRRPEFDYITHLGGAPWRALVRTAIIKENCLQFDPYVRGIGDDILFTLYEYEYVKKIAYIQHPIYHYRIITDSYTHGYTENYWENVSRVYEKIEEFLKKYSKDERTWRFYYLRVQLYLRQGMQRYFHNENNPKDAKTLYSEFRNIIQSEPYRTACISAPGHLLMSRRKRVGAYLLKFNCTKVYYKMSKISRK